MMAMERGGGFVPADTGKAVWFLGHLYVIKATAKDTGGRYTILEVTVAPGLVGEPPHRHLLEDEAFYVLEGTLTVQLDGRTVEAETGSFVYAHRGLLHGFTNTGQAPARLLVVIAPPGFERFLEEVGEPAQRGLGAAGPEGLSDFSRLVEVGRKYQMELQAPSPGESEGP